MYDLQKEIQQSQTIMKIINEKLKNEDWLDEDQKESLAYRITSIMVSAKNLYTEIAPLITEEEKKLNMQDLLVEFRWHYLNLSDLINEFEELFMGSIIPDEKAVMPDEEHAKENFLSSKFEEDEEPA